jgi:hypothetical protein
MAKKNFKTGIDMLIQSSKNNIEIEKTADKEKSKPEFQKATYYFNSDTLSAIKSIAWYNRQPIGEVINEALKAYVTASPIAKVAMESHVNKGFKT